jgi:hypothetical protein
LTEALSKATVVIEKQGNDFYGFFERFLEEEYYKYYDNEEVPIELNEGINLSEET